MVEILLFAVLSVYLFYRLWSVLGTRTGHEKQRQWHRRETTDENVIILPKKNATNQTELEVVAGEAKVDEPFSVQIKGIRKSIKDFTIERFQKGSANAFCAVVQAYAQGNVERLEQLVAPKVLKGFQQAINLRAKQKETMSIDIKSVDTEIERIDLDKSTAQIQVCFTSDQLVTTINKSGEIIDNPSQITNRMIDRWTFEKDLKDSGLVWKLVKTESLV